MANIFHELAEKAFTEKIFYSSDNKQGDYMPTILFSTHPKFRDPVRKLWRDTFGINSPDSGKFYTDMSSKDQALALLFIGEMYEASIGS